MKIKRLLEILRKEDPDLEVAVWLAGKDGWEIVDIGVGDAVVGTTEGPNGIVLLPVELPEKLLEWDKGPDQLSSFDESELPDIEAEA